MTLPATLSIVPHTNPHSMKRNSRYNGPRLGRRALLHPRISRDPDINTRPAQLAPRAVAGVQRPARPPKVARHEQAGRGRREAQVGAVAQAAVKV